MQPKLPPGPRLPAALQMIGWWSRPIGYIERCRARYGKRFTTRFVATPPFVMLSTPEDIREVFQAPPDVLHPGEGARILEPVVGSYSLILLDEKPHLEQRKLLTPAFHGQKMKDLTGLITEVTEAEVSKWPRDRTIELHPRFQALTLEVILRAVFGLDEGERLDALRDKLTELLASGARPESLLPEPKRDLGPLTATYRRFAALRDETDAMIFGLIDERRAN